MIAVIIAATGIGIGSLFLAALAHDARAQARKDREAAQRIHDATREHVRQVVTRKPYSVGESPLAMLVPDNGRMVPLPIPRGAHPVFARLPVGKA